jgi:LysR family transcriptional regulator, cell division regulator
MINPTDLKYFIELAKTQHVSKAAERLGVSQPALSHCMKRIEQEMGLTLFLRSKRGVTLTAAGQKLLDSSHLLLQNWQSVLLSAKNEMHEVSGLIRLGCHTAVAQYTLPHFLPAFLRYHPQISFQLQHGLSRHINEAILSGQLDVGLVVNPTPHSDLVIKEILKDRVTFWQAKTKTNPDVLIYDPSLLQSQDLLKKMSLKKIQFKRKIESSSLEVIAQLVVAGAGCGLLPERVMRAFGANSVVTLSDAPSFQDHICLVFKPEFKKMKRGQAFIDAVKASFAKEE